MFAQPNLYFEMTLGVAMQKINQLKINLFF